MRGPAGLARRLGAGPFSWAGIARSSTASHADWLAANEVRARLELSLRRLFAQFDVILAPAAPVAAFPHDHAPMGVRTLKVGNRTRPYLSLLDWSALASVCGLPSTVIPAGRTPQGLPVGAQLIGPRGGDSKTLAVAQAIDEQVIGFTAPA
jgi:amidase